MAAVLQLRVPHVPQAQLHAWFAGGPGAGRWRCLAYWVRRARLTLALLDQLDLVGRTGEMARTFGIDFYSGAASWRVAGALPFLFMLPFHLLVFCSSLSS